jgi:hypothetical protein
LIEGSNSGQLNKSNGNIASMQSNTLPLTAATMNIATAAIQQKHRRSGPKNPSMTFFMHNMSKSMNE